MNDFETFYQLHRQPQPLILANAWNVKSAQLIEKAGFAAIATSSGAIASSMGYPDGEQMPFDEMLYIVRRIKLSTQIPLSVDMERGYSDDLKILNANIQQVIDAGAVGINLEDSQGEKIYLKKLSSIKTYLKTTNQQLFINARTDAFLQKLPEPLETVIRRARLYQDLGADGLFVTGVQDTDIIKSIVAATALPVNVVGVSKLASVATLTDCKVSRISMAGLLFSAGYKMIEGMLTRIKSEESFAGLFA